MSRRERVALAAIAVMAFVLRVWWAGAFAASPQWSDPDGYADMSRLLVDSQGWHWTRRAVQFAEFTKAPLYQVLLSAVWRIGDLVSFVNAALVLHALLNALTPIALYVIGSRLHTRRAGFIAAALYAVWLPNIMPTATFWQEQLYIPALAWAMAATALAMETREPRRWMAAGAMFAVAALTRSSITYFVVPAALLMAISERPRSTAMREAALLLAGFALLVVPYVIYISAVTGRLTFIESIGYFSLKRFDPVSAADPRINLLAMMHDPMGPPTTGEVLTFLWRDFAASPGTFLLRRLDFLRLLVKPGGASYLANQFVSTAGAASLARVAVHAALDLPFVAALVLAPIGAALAKRGRLAAVLAVWPPVLFALVALTLWAGTRFRAPAEPVLVTLAAAVLAGGWRRPGGPALALAISGSLAVAALVAVSVPSIVEARANYGVAAAPSRDAAQRFAGGMGAYVTSTGKSLSLDLRTDAAGAVAIDVFVDGKKADAFSLTGGAVRRYTFDAPRRVYLEIAATAGGAAVPMTVRLE